jgi:hypothetical protein
MSFMLRRRARLTPAALHHYWLNFHADFGRRLLPPHSYYQLHALAEESAAISRVAGLTNLEIDGVGEAHFPDVDTLTRHLGGSEASAQAPIDERNFIDHSRLSFALYRMRTA